jgi:hypothetical protein
VPRTSRYPESNEFFIALQFYNTNLILKNKNLPAMPWFTDMLSLKLEPS